MAALVLGSDGNFYGTASTAGISGGGTLFQITPAGVLTTLYSFYSTGSVSGLVEDSAGNFYGTTVGLVDVGSGESTFFQIDPAGVLTILDTIDGFDTDERESTLLLGSDGNLYGTAEYGGAKDFGRVFQLTPAGVLKTLYRFSGGSDGSQPDAGLVLGGDGNFYGTTMSGGDAEGDGTVFQMTPAGVLTTLHALRGGSDG